MYVCSFPLSPSSDRCSILAVAICSFAKDASDHDGDWNYYKQQAKDQRDIIGQLSSLLETYGYHLPAVSGRPHV